ncbi:3-keto-5-aminohexanoate cleavage protein [Papillibacter cinnamivorans]|uniref:Uncharacterized conserved protein, DUF849 family n=1 Tax=Papillibacter cinnamivorans DSM 12816 TaxID=1122930 RepID=A0A1W2AJG0_9FIRM|nr:3-keto-5-aminohexanoate cleavage protein [Papillibacter cinnamivorans]SMC60388.1 Uncharacterized conserved protein, DUF849 family [Papillibacter cinnamivorans DSM 12816]
MANSNTKVVITAALTGAVHTPSLSPYLPWKHQDLIAQGVAAYKAGAAMIHIHGRNQQDGRPSALLEDFRIVMEGIKREAPDVIMIPTTGGSLTMTTAERANVVAKLKPEMASFTPGSMNFNFSGLAAKPRQWKYDWEQEHCAGSEDRVFYNTFKVIREYGEIFTAANTRPEYEIFDIGMLNNLATAIKMGQLSKEIQLQYVLGTLGGMPADPESIYILLSESKRLLGNDFTWSVSSAGKQQMAMMATTMTFGGNVRVGLEDALYLEKGVLAKSNAELVEKVVRIAKEIGKEIATPAEAREIIGLKGIENVAF